MRKSVVIIRSNAVRPDSRVEKEALALYNAGYYVRVLCWDRDSEHKATEELLVINGKQIPIIRLGYKASFGEGFKNIVPYLNFQFAMRDWLKRNLGFIDVVHACDFDTAFFSHNLVLRRNKKFIFDIFDFLFGDPANFFQSIIKKLQFRIINKADATIICTEEREKQIEGSNPQRLIVVHNTPSEEQLPNDIVIENRKTAKPKVCYIGILQDGRLLKEISDYFSRNDDAELHVGGFGYLEPLFQDLASKVDNVKYYGRLPYDKTLELETNSDIMLAIYDPTIENHRYAAPNKFYESLFLGKPVIMVEGTGMSSVVKDKGIGSVITYSQESFAQALRDLINRKDSWSEIKDKAHNLYKNKYSWEKMEKRLIDLYEELCE